MPLIRWNDRFLLDVTQIDIQLQGLVELSNSIFDEFQRGASVRGIQPLVDMLVHHASYHFAYEESWMIGMSYPDLVEHKKEHEQFVERVYEVQQFYEQGTDYTLNLLLFLNRWITYHLNCTNSKLISFIEENKRHMQGYNLISLLCHR